jgi:hypothetical protein
MYLKYSKKTAETAKNTDTLFRLFQKKGDVLLWAVDKKGERINQGAILSIDNDIKGIVIQKELNQKIDVKTDIQGQPLYATLNELKKLDGVPSYSDCDSRRHDLSDMIEKIIGRQK